MAPQIVIMRTFSATNDDKNGIMTTIGFKSSGVAQGVFRELQFEKLAWVLVDKPQRLAPASLLILCYWTANLDAALNAVSPYC